MSHEHNSFWGKPTASLDWCEVNYVYTPYHKKKNYIEITNCLNFIHEIYIPKENNFDSSYICCRVLEYYIFIVVGSFGCFWIVSKLNNCLNFSYIL